MLAALVGAAGVGRAAPATPEGRWLTEGHDGVIEIAACEDGFCGRIVGMREPVQPDGTVPRDPSGRPQCGLTILRAVPRADGLGWRGRIENPDDGSQWRCELWLADDGSLDVRGYVAIPLLGETQRWTRYAGALGPGCRMQ